MIHPTKFIAAALLGLSLSACVQTNIQTVAGTSAAPEIPPERARNVILFVGDGMGVSTVTAARIYDGQTRGEPGEENLLSFERFPNTALVKTYNTNQQVPDSAGTATAMTTGVKTRAGVINVGPQAQRANCAEALEHPLTPIAVPLAEEGLAIGIVSTARITHATPAAMYAVSPERNWEDSQSLPAEARAQGCTDIAAQLMQFPFQVALGGGSAPFFGADLGGRRSTASDNLPADWAARTGGTVVTTAAELAAAPQDGTPLFGVFSPSHMTYAVERTADTTEPTLSEMTAAAITRLSGDEDGFFLMVEAGRIDHGHHDGRAELALGDAQEFANAVSTALGMVDLEDTLILVTADHSHVFTIAGYPTRGNPILGLVESNDDSGEPTGAPELAEDGMPYTTLGYQNGPGAIAEWPRPAPDMTGVVRQQATVPLYSETHAGEDVPLYAIGPGSDRVRGVIEQNVIYDIMMRALGYAGRD